MAIKVTAVTDKGGAVQLNDKHGVWASYVVTTAGDLPPDELLMAAGKLPDGRGVQFFLNRQTGLVVVAVIDKGGRSGCEILRRTV